MLAKPAALLYRRCRRYNDMLAPLCGYSESAACQHWAFFTLQCLHLVMFRGEHPACSECSPSCFIAIQLSSCWKAAGSMPVRILTESRFLHVFCSRIYMTERQMAGQGPQGLPQECGNLRADMRHETKDNAWDSP